MIFDDLDLKVGTPQQYSEHCAGLVDMARCTAKWRFFYFGKPGKPGKPMKHMSVGQSVSQ